MHPALHAPTQPDKAAYIIAETGETLTYRELDALSTQGARFLRSLGLTVRDHIAVMLENDLPFVKISWAANRAGLYFTPISTALTKAEIEYITNVVREQLDEESFNSAWEKGQAMSLEQAVAFALEKKA